MKFCKDCKWLVNLDCTNPKAEKARDPVSGNWPAAITMRETQIPYGPDVCSHSAQWFEAREPEDAKNL